MPISHEDCFAVEHQAFKARKGSNSSSTSLSHKMRMEERPCILGILGIEVNLAQCPLPPPHS